MARIPDMVAIFGDMPGWLSLLIVTLVMAYSACVFGVAFGKMGRSPFWGLLMLLPFVGLVLLWSFGLGRWPLAKQPEPALDEGL